MFDHQPSTIKTTINIGSQYMGGLFKASGYFFDDQAYNELTGDHTATHSVCDLRWARVVKNMTPATHD